jgi:glycosyltransferase involved in cell wall biosynthesis
MTPLLSAIIPIGNVNGNLFSLGETIQASKHIGVEIIIIHDDFCDGTSEALEKLSKEYGDFRLLTGQFRAPGLARNLGLRNVNSEWFCFWDVDDNPNVKEYVHAIEELSDESKSVIIGNFVTKNELTGKTRNWNLPTNCQNLMAEIAMNPGIWRFVFRASSYMDFEFGSASMGEDQLFLAQLNLKERDIHVSNRKFYQYSTNIAGQLTGQKYRVRELLVIIESENILRRFPQNSNLIDYLILKQSFTILKHQKVQLFRTIWLILISMTNLRLQGIKFVYKVAKSKK